MGLSDRKPTTLEEYDDYKVRFNNWGRWGDDDQFGTLNHITREGTKHAVGLVQDGRTVSCANPLATAAVVSDERRNGRPADHRMSVGATGSGDYVGVSYHGFVNTHIDALCHIFTKDSSEGGRIYNDRDPALITDDGALTNSVENWRDGIVTRGVLYDIPRMRGQDYLEIDHPVEGWDLEDWASSKGITPRDGDIVLVRSGSDKFWAANPDHQFSFPPNTPGNAPSIIEYLYDTNAAMLGWDLQEAGHQHYEYPARIVIHEVVIPHMGMPLLDNANFERLSEVCAETGRYEFLLTIAPLVVNGGTGSPVNPIATF
ncbi:MAG: cyclase family protein [SAR202 cluster bacterium]|jgi:kynurenine formamidase|nr:cyclase family protein [SAR202 cluster bacterium]MDP6514652.1 cyclase family protein [SAR202 cluster bacterium]MDP6713914.1 cyclase family protein [SAR202 cluster bacterium]